MPRRTATDAEKLAEQVKNARWRYAIRHPISRREMRRVGQLRGTEAESVAGLDWQGSYKALLQKWRCGDIPHGALDGLVTSDSDPADEVSLLGGFTKDVRAYPVMVGELNPGQRIVRLVVDLDNSLDMLVSLAERELRGLVREYRENPNQRRRFDKQDFYLEVFDRHERGETFSLIALALRKPESTVKSAFVAVTRSIAQLIPRDEGSPLPSLEDLQLASVDSTHFQRCRECKAGSRGNNFCRAMRAYLGQDEVPLREKLSLGPFRD